jgi:hypothetical protein
VLIEHHEQGETVRHGDAPRGVDRHVRKECIRLRWPQDPCPAEWRPDGVFDRAAGHKRNDYMMRKEPVPRLLLAFQWEGSSGTASAIAAAHRHGIWAQVYTEHDMRPDIAALDYEEEPIYLGQSSERRTNTPASTEKARRLNQS